MKRRSLLAGGLAWPGVMRGQLEERMEVEAHRPLAAMADLLEARFGIAVNYEDPPYVLREDLEDVATRAQKESHPGCELLVPRKGRVSIASPTAKGMDGLAMALRETVAAYSAAKLPEEFQVERSSEGFTIAPVGHSVLAFRPTVMMGRRPLLEHLTELLKQSQGVKISVGSGPFLPPYPMGFGVAGVTARVAVARMMAAVGSRRMSYRLLYDYKWQGYMMNFQVLGAV